MSKLTRSGFELEDSAADTGLDRHVVDVVIIRSLSTGARYALPPRSWTDSAPITAPDAGSGM
jgi:hypothetical protein